jgi:hypothetical protein
MDRPRSRSRTGQAGRQAALHARGVAAAIYRSLLLLLCPLSCVSCRRYVRECVRLDSIDWKASIRTNTFAAFGIDVDRSIDQSIQSTPTVINSIPSHPNQVVSRPVVSTRCCLLGFNKRQREPRPQRRGIRVCEEERRTPLGRPLLALRSSPPPRGLNDRASLPSSCVCFIRINPPRFNPPCLCVAAGWAVGFQWRGRAVGGCAWVDALSRPRKAMQGIDGREGRAQQRLAPLFEAPITPASIVDRTDPSTSIHRITHRRTRSRLLLITQEGGAAASLVDGEQQDFHRRSSSFLVWVRAGWCVCDWIELLV